jgi:hypothetical protein
MGHTDRGHQGNPHLATTKEGLNKSTDHAARSLSRARSEHDGPNQFL